MRSSRLRNREKLLQFSYTLLAQKKSSQNLETCKVRKRVINLSGIIDDIVISKKLVQLFFRNALANIVCMLTLVRMISHDTSYSLQLKTLSTQVFSQNIVCNAS